MPISTQWEDTTYVQQLDGKLYITVNAPTYIERVMPIRAISSSPASTTQGYIYWDTTNGCVRYYTGSSWSSIAPDTRENGVVYYNLSNGYFYKWVSGTDLTQVVDTTTVNTWKAVYWYLKSVTTQPTDASVGDTYYNSSTHKIYYYNSVAWVEIGTPVYALDTTHKYGYMWYVTSETVVNLDGTTTEYTPILWYDPTAQAMDYRYRQAVIYVRDYYSTQTYHTINTYMLAGKSYTAYADMLFATMGSDTSCYPYKITVRYYDITGRRDAGAIDFIAGTGNTSEFADSQEWFGRGGDSITTTLVQSATLPAYPTTENEFILDFRCTPSSASTASVLVPLESRKATERYLQYGLTWKVAKIGGTGGQFNNKTLAEAAQGAYMMVTSTTSNNYFNSGRVFITFRESGRYDFTVSYKYRNTSQTVISQTKTLTIYVYSKATPSISVVSSSPSESGDFPPPYTVVLRDTSSTTDAYQIPQQTITMDAGDSADPESWTLENTGTTLITMPDKTHVYNGYGAYRPTLTIVDKNGNSATATTSFAPNKTPRVYTPAGWTSPARLEYGGSVYYPSSTVAGGNAPILVVAKASVAGDPLPTVTWTYGISGSTYYTGTVTGAYAELSLLASGTYDVTCTVTNGTTTIATYTWTVTVQNEVVSTEQDKTMDDFSLVVLNGTTPVDVCKVHTTPQYTTQWQTNDTVQFEVPRNYPYAQYLQEGDMFVFGHHGAKLMQVSYRQQNERSITISGTSVFPQRVAITATRSEANDGYDVQTCSAEALIRYYIHSALSDPYGTQTRGADLMIHGTCHDYPTGGDAVTYSARYETLQDIVTELCGTSGLGYSVGIRNMTDGSIDKSQVWIKEGTIRTYTSGGNNAVIFSTSLKNCRIASDQSSMSANVSIGAGQGIGNFREYTYYDINGSTPSVSGFSRREVFVDAGDAADADEIKRMSVLELKQAKQLSIRIQVLPSCQWVYGTDYDVGDTVTLIHPERGQLDLQIYSAEHVRRQTGDELYLNLGYRAITAPALISRVSAQNTYARK